MTYAWISVARAAGPSTVVFLCVQVRCVAAHAATLAQAPSYFAVVEDRTDELHAMPGQSGSRAAELETKLLVFRGALIPQTP